jgi:HrpA-like RNA helicase
MPAHQQTAVFKKTPHQCRKVILATNIAETSITISGIRYVIDTGLRKVRGYHSRIGMESLTIQPISKASSNQRMGRAGREAPGVCYRLFAESTYQTLASTDDPEIQRYAQLPKQISPYRYRIASLKLSIQ